MRTLFPYEVLGADPNLAVSSVTLDGEVPTPYPVEEHLRLIELARAVEPSEWQDATFTVELTAPPERLGRHPHAQGLVVATCAATNLRQGVVLERQGAGRFGGTLVLSRDECRHRVDLVGEISDTVEGISHRRLATTPVWHARFDTAEPPPIHGTLEGKWVDFGSSEVIPLDAVEESFYLALDGPMPTVYLNSGMDGLFQLLGEGEGRPQLEAQLRETELRRIATAAWTAVFNVSVAGIRREGDDAVAEWPNVEWQERALRGLLPRAYVDDEPEEALEKAYDEHRDGTDVLQTRIQLAVSKLLGSGRALGKGLARMSAG